MYEDSNPMLYCLEQFSSKKLIQESENATIVKALLALSEDAHGMKENVGSYCNKKKKESKCEYLQPWKVCCDNTSHRIDLLADDIINIQRHLRRSNRVVNDVSGTFGQQRHKACSQNWASIEMVPKTRVESGSNNRAKSEGKVERFCDNFKHCPSPEDHIKRYRKEVTFKILKESTELVSRDRRPTIPKDISVPVCCSQVLTKIKAIKRKHKSISKASFVCYNLNFEEKNGLKEELGCLRVGSIDGMSEATKKVEEKIAARSFNIPSITLPSLKEILEYPMSKKPWEGNSTSTGHLQVLNRRKKKIRRSISCTSTKKTQNTNDVPGKKECKVEARDRPSKRSKEFLNYLRPKLPQAAMPRKERSFYACIIPMSNNK